MVPITIAAVVPLYNGAPFIRAALESILAQTSPADEIIVVDDGSTDGGARIVEEMAKSHPITLLSKPNGGQSSARNLAIDACRSSHVALLDQDDIWYPDHLKLLRGPFERDERPDRLALVYGNLDHVDAGGEMVTQDFLDIVGVAHPKQTLQQCIGEDMHILPGASLIERQAFLDVGRFDERLAGYEDDDLCMRLFRRGYRSVYIDVAVSQWRIHSGSTSYSRRMAQSRMIYYRKLIELYPDQPRLNQFWARDVIAPRFFGTSLGDFIAGSRHGEIERMGFALADMIEIAPRLGRRRARRMRLVAPLVKRLYRGRFTNLARLLTRYVTPGARKHRR
jgi:glycosyltransferase involved in cell wall biosynthesis